MSLLIVVVVAVAAFVGGVLVGRRNKNTVDTVVNDAVKAEQSVAKKL